MFDDVEKIITPNGMGYLEWAKPDNLIYSTKFLSDLVVGLIWSYVRE